MRPVGKCQDNNGSDKVEFVLNEAVYSLAEEIQEHCKQGGW